ncbi:MAG: hypothetical protein UR88_C0006G0007 [Candidatus Nomurabacteria bacterium GW2011_GWA1_35_8]|uniref:Uncharacterized protein n=1 Tax=Candidatus Nomurabacteria bacterium GW2011_GWA1_35_8 TaxID=1618727 RepID=A0A0G0CXM3_9BACT|nr:MAG: hypothetical protein UR88_C0006G0007 [Candidatus Nomurabacteria bacterium GW2011_GWA1_35_8]
MKKLNKNPWVWAMAVVVLGYIFMEKGIMEQFPIYVSALIVAKLIEIINKLNKD